MCDGSRVVAKSTLQPENFVVYERTQKKSMNTNIDQSIQISESIVESSIANPNFPFLISFPRTGSHWLRMIMELYFEKPSLVRAFYYKYATSFTCYHRHDKKLLIERENVIYLYRNPAATIYSQMNYYGEDLTSIDRVKFWANMYGNHLQKWLVDETFTVNKTVLTYEALRNNMEKEFAKVCTHFATSINKEKLARAVSKVTREEVKSKTAHDPQVINDSDRYQLNKKSFIAGNTSFICNEITSSYNGLGKFLLKGDEG